MLYEVLVAASKPLAFATHRHVFCLSFFLCHSLTLCHQNPPFHTDNHLYKLVPATSVAVSANMNSVVSIVLAWAAFGKPLGVVQLLGLGLCVGGSAAYIFVETKKRKRVISS